jgi:hypothetical protein
MNVGNILISEYGLNWVLVLSYVTPNLKEKLEVYRSYYVPVYFGNGTLSEAFLIRKITLKII